MKRNQGRRKRASKKGLKKGQATGKSDECREEAILVSRRSQSLRQATVDNSDDEYTSERYDDNTGLLTTVSEVLESLIIDEKSIVGVLQMPNISVSGNDDTSMFTNKMADKDDNTAPEIEDSARPVN
jgi:hypothetical protein